MTTSDNESSNRLDRIEALVERNSQQIERNSQQIERNSQQIERTMQAVDRLASVQLQLAQIFDEERATTRDSLASINAALERIDRLMDYLMRRDGGNSSEADS